MSIDSLTSASTDDPNTLIPLMTFILTYIEDRVVEVPVLKDRANEVPLLNASRAGNANIGPETTTVKP
jgi:hypothetical protein